MRWRLQASVRKRFYDLVAYTYGMEILPNHTTGMNWGEVENALSELQPVAGGYSLATRGFAKLYSGRTVFVKIGTNEQTQSWARREIGAYRFLEQHEYASAPKLLAINASETGFALESLVAEDGWDWSEAWNKPRLEATLAAMDSLASLSEENGAEEFSEAIISEADGGWRPIVSSRSKQALLRAMMTKAGSADVYRDLDFAEAAAKSDSYKFKSDLLVHNDLRGDNCSWNFAKRSVGMIDWNWLQLGDRRIDLAAFLTVVHKSGFNVLHNYRSKLDADALHWLAGMWFKNAITPIWPGGDPHLRTLQLEAGLVALELSKLVARTPSADGDN